MGTPDPLNLADLVQERPARALEGVLELLGEALVASEGFGPWIAAETTRAAVGVLGLAAEAPTPTPRHTPSTGRGGRRCGRRWKRSRTTKRAGCGGRFGRADKDIDCTTVWLQYRS